jgi:hypothetical protein
MKTFFSVLALFFAYNTGRQKRIQKWGRRQYDGTKKPW